jgi:hypothetical protein
MRRWLWEHQFVLAGGAAAVAVTAVLAWSIVSWPSRFESWTSEACDGIRQADAALSTADPRGVAAGWKKTGSLDPAGDVVDSDSEADLNKLWDASNALLRITRQAERSPEASIDAEDQWLVDQGVEVCRSYTYPWFGPARLLL